MTKRIWWLCRIASVVVGSDGDDDVDDIYDDNNDDNNDNNTVVWIVTDHEQ